MRFLAFLALLGALALSIYAYAANYTMPAKVVTGTVATTPVAHVQTTKPTAPKAGKGEPAMMRMVDCESYDIQPCYTYDDGAWRMVTSYSPYHSVKLSVCKYEDFGGPQYPCIWKRDNRVSKGEPVTRNVFTLTDQMMIGDCLTIDSRRIHSKAFAKVLKREGWSFKECVKAYYGM